ncbi:hypothetical protein P153DRAFT_396710 [Dothidotthia symphoricarpi CBS 119687]|uniref:Uncharacterized protein n=1 Tax=Dothidotthia symphoricarpi CBS 119687 TaxID=1392245 RepID=A0A6A6ADU0_9PLEO|nr:uncharacterized protein P153DRAFT_396710 [Dothidotthia symphoricarpi CBS 119687]KAF2129443.1 hypothetical protein P153DRAFT_396710 [Dothidotthia symphoricarpi CBS 119687]
MAGFTDGPLPTVLTVRKKSARKQRTAEHETSDTLLTIPPPTRGPLQAQTFGRYQTPQALEPTAQNAQPEDTVARPMIVKRPNLLQIPVRKEKRLKPGGGPDRLTTHHSPPHLPSILTDAGKQDKRPDDYAANINSTLRGTYTVPSSDSMGQLNLLGDDLYEIWKTEVSPFILLSWAGHDNMSIATKDLCEKLDRLPLPTNNTISNNDEVAGINRDEASTPSIQAATHPTQQQTNPAMHHSLLERSTPTQSLRPRASGSRRSQNDSNTDTTDWIVYVGPNFLDF